MSTAAQKMAARAAKREAEAAVARAAGEKTETQKINEAAITNPGAVGVQPARPSSAGAKVIVGCKLDVPFYDIYICREETVKEDTQTGPREIKRFTPDRQTTVRLRGTAYPRGTLPDGYPERPIMYDGAAMNTGISKEFWDAWAHQNKLNPLFMNKIIFARESEADARAVAKDVAGITSGLAPLNPKKDPRMPKSTNPDVGDLETEEGRAKKMAGAA